ncbi:hypothetical protein G3H63_19060 [Microbacterium resistens]|uniref:amidohydrolase family protein n=1 Tax=Microbacterium resistens TaxID=156977 RepID=UPI001C5A1512|nr:amidohydrolase family protein [Microbacterium resistens]MBW1641163.1 hypothetical protein [Microbacterium resistens]
MTARSRALLASFAALGAVDTTCHLGAWPSRLAASADPDGLRAYAVRHGLRALWVGHLASLFGFDTRSGNEALIDACGADPLFVPFAVLDAGSPTWAAELDGAVAAGFRGIRVAPAHHGTPVGAVLPVLQAAAEHGLPVQLLVRLDDARVRHPRSPVTDPELHRIADLIRVAPVAPLVLSGLNRGEERELRRHFGDDLPAHVHLDLWHVNGPTFVADALAEEPGRWVFGSGFPIQTPEATMLQLAAAALPPEDLRRITSGTATSLLP